MRNRSIEVLILLWRPAAIPNRVGYVIRLHGELG